MSHLLEVVVALYAFTLVGLFVRGMALTLFAFTAYLAVLLAHGLIVMDGRLLNKDTWMATELALQVLEVAVVLQLGQAILGSTRKTRRIFWFCTSGIGLTIAILLNSRPSSTSLTVAIVSNCHYPVLALLIVTLLLARVFVIPIGRLNQAVLVGIAAPLALGPVMSVTSWLVSLLGFSGPVPPYAWTNSILAAGGYASAFIWAIGVLTAPAEAGG